MATIDINTYECSDKGLLLPVINEYTWSTGVRAFLYVVGMLWCFLGVAIVADTFMCGIEHITSKTRTISIPNAKGEGSQQIEVKVWNDTVANLSLLAFGTSAPEILLNVIEICGNSFVAGDLGPGTIVGSAAFNLFIITGICIISIPDGDFRRIQNLRVFAVTSITGIFAYVWLIFVLVIITPKQVDLWEALVTFLMFPLLIIVAYVADKGFCCKNNRTNSEVEIGLDLNKSSENGDGTAQVIDLAREIARDGRISEDEAARALAAKIAKDKPKAPGWYRVNATRMITGGHKLQPKVSTAVGSLLERLKPREHPTSNGVDTTIELSISESSLDPKKSYVEFTAATCAVLENEGHVRIGIRRSGCLSKKIAIGVETIDGTAEAGEDYKPVKQLLVFEPEERVKDIFIEIVDDDIWEPDEFFFVKLYHDPEGSSENDVVIGKLSINQVTIVNDDEPGKLEFTKPSYIVKESAGSAQLVIQRVNGADGEIQVSWKSKDMSAKQGQDYAGGQGVVTFNHGETSKIINIDIFGIHDHRKEPNFQVELFNPTAGAELGKVPKSIVTIINDEEFNNLLTRLNNKTKQNLEGLKLDSGSWAEQFRSAMNVNGGDLDEASMFDYIMHFLTFFWKVLFAFIPPTHIGGGWLTFTFSLLMIGLLTAIISDLASIFGCLIGLADTITAITFVALGTSMPDTFASKSAAINEKWADSSIGNINGSNSVNVFLGLGLPWLMAAIYWEVKGTSFAYPTDSLAFSVTIFTIFAVVLLSMLVLRRKLVVFGKAELGGPRTPKILTALLAFALWLIYIIFSCLQSYNIISTF